MKRMIKILTIPAVLILVYTVFNWNTVLLALEGQVIILYLIVLLCLILPGYIVSETWIAPYLFRKQHGTLTGSAKVNKAMKPEKRRKLAREYINELRMTDPAMQAANGYEMVLIRNEPSPSRDDAIQWDMFVFTTTQEASDWNPMLGIDGISWDKLFYIIENSMTGECNLMRFDSHEDAQKYLWKLWQSGVMKIEASEYDKIMKRGFAQQLGGEIAKKTVDDKKEEEEN